LGLRALEVGRLGLAGSGGLTTTGAGFGAGAGVGAGGGGVLHPANHRAMQMKLRPSRPRNALAAFRNVI
jgi:hypothetical protein